MKLLQGYHLTATRRKAIRAILDAGLTDAQVGMFTYHLTHNPDQTLSVAVKYREHNGYEMRERVDHYTIEGKL